MSNIFKSNSRFAVLAEELTENKDKKNDKKDKKNDKKENEENKKEDNIEKFNSFKDDKSSFKNKEHNDFIFNNRYKNDSTFNKKNFDYGERKKEREKTRIEFEEREKEKLRQQALQPENFPDLFLQNKKNVTENKNSLNFIDKITKNDVSTCNTNKIKDPDLEELKPGWLLLKRDPNTGKTIMKNHFADENKEKMNLIQKEKTEEKITKEVFKKLSELYEKRTQEFIDLNGYDTWERMFKFKGWREWEEDFNDTSDDEYIEDNRDADDEDNILNEY